MECSDAASRFPDEAFAPRLIAIATNRESDARAAATFLLVEKLEDIVSQQVEAVKNLKIDKVTVWDSGASTPGGSAGI